MIINAHTGIERYPRSDMLTKIEIPCHLMHGAVDECIGLPVAFAFDKHIAGTTTESEIIQSDGQTVAAEHLHTLVSRHSRHIIV